MQFQNRTKYGRKKSKKNLEFVDLSEIEPPSRNPRNLHSHLTNPGLKRTLILFWLKNADVAGISVSGGPAKVSKGTGTASLSVGRREWGTKIRVRPLLLLSGDSAEAIRRCRGLLALRLLQASEEHPEDGGGRK
jgi:hypothetical protein